MKKILGYGFQIAIAGGVLIFEMIESVNFFFFAFKDEQWYLAYLGFFLTSIAMLGYFYDFRFIADTKLKKSVSLVMMIACAIGSVITAGFGFNVASNQHTGFTFTQSEIASMTLAIQILIGMHILALIIYNAGDAIVQALKDDDGDGIPNILDKKDDRKAPPVSLEQTRQYQAQIEALTARLEQLENPTKAGSDK